MRHDDFMRGFSSDHGLGGGNTGISRSNLELTISGQAQYLVRLQGDFTCLAHCT